MKLKSLGFSGLFLVLVLAMSPGQAEAGSGYFYGAHAGMWNFLESEGAFSEADGGWEFGPQAGLYFIASGLALMLDATASFGLAGEDLDTWWFEVPTIRVVTGAGTGPFAIFVGGGISLFGLDDFNDDPTVSLANPQAIGGIQLGIEGFVFRGEYHIGHNIRIGEDDLNWHNIQITLGYGLYADFL